MTYPQLLTPEEKLTDAKTRLGIPRIVAICGSTRFMDLMTEVDLLETANGHIVVKPGCNMKQPHPLWNNPADAEVLKARLDDLHRAKIRLADEVLVVGDYVGDSTTAEIAYARSLGKPVRFTHPEVDPGEMADEPPATAYGDGKGSVYCLGCHKAVGDDVSLTASDVDTWDLCPSCGRHVVDVARAAAGPQPAATPDVARRTAAKARQNGAQ